MRPTYAVFMSSFLTPNLIVQGRRGRFDLTATFARIELGYGSHSECDEKEAQRRRADKELLKLRCVKYAISGEDENNEEEENTALYWLLPPEHSETAAYTLLHRWSDPEDFRQWEEATGRKKQENK